MQTDDFSLNDLTSQITTDISDPIESTQGSSDEEFQLHTDDELEAMSGDDDLILPSLEKSSKILLSSKKSPQDQMKFIVFEESVANLFSTCFKCSAHCVVSIESDVGTLLNISVCCSGNPIHDFIWSTGPVHNKLPILHLMITLSVLCNGLECEKIIRFFSSLNIKCFKRREFTKLQTAYVVPSVFSVWKKRQHELLQDMTDKTCSIASVMRVDSPGHTGLFGSGSSMDVERNVILDTQVIKVAFITNLTSKEIFHTYNFPYIFPTEY